jgi:SAM-dependent methyltransferase
MFYESATLYDLIYSHKNYQKEAGEIVAMINARHPACRSILDVGCGTAEHHRYLKNEFPTDGLDINEEFIDLARTKNEAGRYYVSDMADFHLDKKYDVILCLFSAIGYVGAPERMIATFKCFYEHLNDDGLVILEPWFTPESWYDGRLHMLTYDKQDLKICRMNRSETDGRLSVVDFHYLVATPEKGVGHFVERHQLTLYSRDEMTHFFREAGFEIQYDEKGLIGRGMYFATKKGD